MGSAHALHMYIYRRPPCFMYIADFDSISGTYIQLPLGMIPELGMCPKSQK